MLQRGAGGSGSLTASEIDTVISVSTAVSVFSILGSWSIVVCYWRYAHLRKFAMTLVLMLSLSDIGNQLADFISPTAAELDAMEAGGPITATCYSQAILDSFFELASVTWTSAIAATLFMSVFMRRSSEDIAGKFWAFNLVCFGVPALLALLPLADNSYGPAGAWCWVTRDYWRALQFYVPLWVCIAFNSVVYVRVLRLLHRTVRASGPGDATAQTIRKFIARLQWYPFILVLVWIWATVNRVYELATGGEQVFWLYLLQRVFSSSQGLCNAVAYGLTSDGVREAVGADLAKLSPRLFGGCTKRGAGAGGAGGLEDGLSSSGGGGGGAGGDGGGGRSEAGRVSAQPGAGAASGKLRGGAGGGGSGAAGGSSSSGGGGGVGGGGAREDDTFAAAAAAYGGVSPTTRDAAASAASTRRLVGAGGDGAVDDRVLPTSPTQPPLPPPPPPVGGGVGATVVRGNPLALAGTAASSSVAAASTREDRVRALQSGGGGM